MGHIAPRMADKRFLSLPGFRDFTPKECAVRNYLFDVWRSVATRYGFSEYEAPMLELTELYMKKTGDELPTQLFRFEDQGGRDVTLRPELTASLARIVSGNQRDLPKHERQTGLPFLQVRIPLGLHAVEDTLLHLRSAGRHQGSLQVGALRILRRRLRLLRLPLMSLSRRMVATMTMIMPCGTVLCSRG